MAATPAARVRRNARAIPKAATGIRGIDEITAGGFPRGRPTLVCGTAGSGKTLLAMEFLVRGATHFGEPGLFMSFEETAEELAANVRSLGFDVADLAARGEILIDHVLIERSEIEETGEYNLDGLFIRLAHGIDTIGAKRVVLDTIEALFSGFSNVAILRAELRRLFTWLKARGVTTMITGERGEGRLTRHGLEEYVSDCVILLDHRVTEQITTRRLRIVKYRGSAHGTNEYPFLIDEQGFSVLPITSVGLTHEASRERISTGIAGLDEMFGGGGIYRGSSVLVSGTAGTGKTTLAAYFADRTCRRGERCLYLAYEESPAQILRNMASVGLDLGLWVKKGLLKIHAVRPFAHGLEMHLVSIHKLVQEFGPRSVVMDPITNLVMTGTLIDTKTMLVRLIDELKSAAVTLMLTSLTAGGPIEATDVGVSSLIDTWILVRTIESAGERNRVVYLLKSRGMGHSNQVRELLLSSRGAELRPAYLGAGGLVTGSARLAQEARDRGAELATRQDAERRRLELAAREASLAAQLAALQAELRAVADERQRVSAEEAARRSRAGGDEDAMARSRQVNRPKPIRSAGRASNGG